MELLKIEKEDASRIKREVGLGIKENKPGYLRLDVTFYFQPYEIEYIANATEYIARYLSKPNPLYTVIADGNIQTFKFNQKVHNHIFSLEEFESTEHIIDEKVPNDKMFLGRERKLK